MTKNYIVIILLSIFIALVNPIKIVSGETSDISEKENKLEQTALILDLAIFLDDGTDVMYAHNIDESGAVSETLEGAIKYGIPFITTANLIPLIKEYAPVIFDLLISDKWLLMQSKEGLYVIGLPKKRWRPLDITDLANLKYIGFNKENVKKLNNEDIHKIADIKSEQKIPLNEIDLKQLENLFADNHDVKKNIYLNGHGEQMSIAQLNVKIYQQFLAFLNNQNVQILYISSCYSGGASLLNAYQKKILEYADPLNLNYFLFVGSLTDADAIATEVDFKNFFDAIHTFFSPQGPAMKKPLETIAQAVWEEEFLNVPSVRFPGSVNYFKALDVDNSIEIITYAKARAAELEESIAKQRKLTSLEKSLNVKKGKQIILLYPPVLRAPLNLEGPTIRKFISMIPGNSIQYIDTLIAKQFINLDAIDRIFSWIKSTHFEAKKVIFINNVTTKNEQGSVVFIVNNACITIIHLNKEKSLYTIETIGKEDCKKIPKKSINYEIAVLEIREAIKKIGPWQQLIGDERPEDLIEAALTNK